MNKLKVEWIDPTYTGMIECRYCGVRFKPPESVILISESGSGHVPWYYYIHPKCSGFLAGKVEEFLRDEP